MATPAVALIRLVVVVKVSEDACKTHVNVLVATEAVSEFEATSRIVLVPAAALVADVMSPVLVEIENPSGKFVRVRFVEPKFVVAKNRSAPLLAVI
jgi:hypothetical protein